MLGFGLFITGVVAFVIATILTVFVQAGLRQPIESGLLVGFVAWVATVVTGVVMTRRLESKLRKPLSQDDQHRREFRTIIKHLVKLDQSSKLLMHMDPGAAQILESGAFHWARTMSVLNGKEWKEASADPHWQSLSERTKESADLAMIDLMLLAGVCTGEPVKNRSEDLKVAFQDIAGLEISSGLRGLAQVAKADSDEYRYRSDRTRYIYKPSQEIVERLAQLADMVSENSFTVREQDVRQGLRSKESIEMLMNEFTAIKEAEQELHENN